ncbi:MAG: energy transducer TonB, partial [Flavobacterium sp.]
MSKLSIYETGWIDFVFQDRNKEYGAYQLRQESTKTTLKALFVGVSVLVTAISVPAIVRAINPSEITKPTLPEIIETTVKITDIVRIEEPVQRALPPVKNQVENPIKNVPFVNPVVVASSQATQDVPTTAAIIASTPTASEGTGTAGANISTN